MEILRDSVVFVLFLSFVVVAKHSSTHIWNSKVAGSEHKWYDIYYDVITSKKIPIVQRFGDRQDEPDTARFGRIPCSCQNLMCGCCAQFNVRLFNYNKRGCMNFTYDPFEFSVKGNMFMDNESKYEYKISAKNPPPACMQVPIPYVPSMDVCLKMFDVYTPGRNLHACVNFLTRIEHAEVLVLEFDCFVMGRDGVSVEKYNASSAAAATTAVYDTTALAADSEIGVTDANNPTMAPDLDLTVTDANNPTTAPDLDLTVTDANNPTGALDLDLTVIDVNDTTAAPGLDFTVIEVNDTTGGVLRRRAVVRV